MLIPTSRLNAQTVYLLFSGATSLSFSIIFTVNLVYQVEVAKLNPLQLVLVGTVVDAFGQIVGGPPVGYIGTAFSIRAALVVASAILSPVLLLYAYAVRKSKEKLTQPS